MSETRSGISEARIFNTVLFIVFLVLKLCHVIAWSWWWVFAPFWVPLGLAIVGAVLVGIGRALK
jgi:hypothetical protein